MEYRMSCISPSTERNRMHDGDLSLIINQLLMKSAGSAPVAISPDLISEKIHIHER